MRIIVCLLAAILFIKTATSQTISPAGPVNICAGTGQVLTVTGSTGSPTFQWQLNGTNIGGATASAYTVTSSGNYTVILNAAGTPDTLGPVVVNVRPVPVASFTFYPNSGCPRKKRKTFFTSTSTITSGTLTYQWNFGDPNSGPNNTSTSQNPNHSFVGVPGGAPQSFTVQLIVTSNYGCADTVTQVISFGQFPDATLTDPVNVPEFTLCGTNTFDITAVNSSSTTAFNTFYELNWGDGSPVFTGTSMSQLTHIYPSQGYFNMMFIVSSSSCRDTAEYTVYIGSNPGVGLSTNGATVLKCVPSVDTFYINTLATSTNPPGTVYTVSFNDGSGDLTFTHPPPTFFTHTFTTSSCGATGGITPNTFYVRIKAENPCGVSYSTVEPITTISRPEAHFAVSPDTIACINSNVTFTNTSINGIVVNGGTCNANNAINWVITPVTGSGTGNLVSGSFGTPTVSGTQSIVVSFPNPGTYSIKLYIRNTASSGSPCRSDSIERIICIEAPPMPSFTLSSTISCAPDTINLTNTSAAFPACKPATRLWTITKVSSTCVADSANDYVFVSGTNAGSLNPVIRFNNQGVYNVTLSMTNSCGTITTLPQVITIKRRPQVTVTVPSSFCSGTVSPAATALSCLGTISSYAWSFPGGTPSSASTLNPGTINYSTAGNYTITLVVTNECGSTAQTMPITVKPTPVPALPSNVIVCTGEIVGPLNFTSNPAGAIFTWTNSNTAIGLASSGTSNPIPAFTATNATGTPIAATINVNATLNGCLSSNSFSITVNPKPAAPVATTPVNYCQNAVAVPLSATATPGNTLLWYTTAVGGTGSTTAPTPVTSIPGTTIYYVSQVIPSTSCEGPRKAITVNVNPGQAIGSATFINPTSCSSLTGSITLNGLTPNTTYTVTYTKNGVPFTFSFTSSATGVIVIPNLGAGLYDHIKVTLNGCSSNEVGPFTLSDPSAPALPNISANGPLCTGNTLNLSSSTSSPGTATYSWTGPNGFTSALQNPFINNITLAAAGTYNVVITISGCSSPVASVPVVINQTPATPVASNNGPLCGAVGLSLNLSSSTSFPGAVTYSWTGPNGFSSSLQNPSIPSVTASDAGVYTVMVTANAGNCSSQPATTTVIINPTPVIGGSSSVNPSGCGTPTGSITLTGLAVNTIYVVNYIKNGTPQTISISSNALGILIIPGLTAGNYTNITVSLSGCPSAPLSISLTDPNPPASPVASANTPLCSSNTLTLQATAVAGGTYLWNGPNGFTSTVQNPSIPVVTTAANGTYTVTVTVSNCTSPAGSVSVLIYQTPATPSGGSNSPLCGSVGATLNLNASTSTVGTITYNWTGPNGFSSANQNPAISNVTTAMSGVYTVTATGNPGNCISSPANIPVLVKPTPVISGNSHTDPVSCGSSTGSISLTGLDPNTSYTVNYTLNSNPQTATIISTVSGVLLINNLAQGTYSDIYVVLNGCPSSVIGPVVLNDPNPPATPSVSSNSPVCSGTILNLSASTSLTGAITFSWSGPNGFTSNQQNPVIPNISTAASGVYSVTITLNNCISAPASTTVLVNALPAAPVVASPLNYCINSTAIPLTANVLPGHTAYWYTVATGGTGNTNAPTPSTSGTGTTSYYVSQVSGNTGCESVRSNLDVTVNPDAIAFFDPPDTIKCPPFNITTADVGLQTFPANNATYEWYANGVFIGSGINFPGYTIVNEDDFVTIKLKTISLFGCKSDSMSRVFRTYKLPHPSFTLSDTVGCGPLSVTILNTTQNISLFTYSWNFGNGQPSTVEQPGTVTFLPNPNSGDTTYVISLSIYSICDTITIKDSVRVKAKPKALFIPSRTSGCSPMTVVFTNISRGINNSYSWDFGDGTTYVTSSQAPVSHTYNTGVQDIYYVKLIAANECGSDSITYSIIVAPNNINLNFTVNGPNIYGCAPHTVAFYNNTSGASSFNWDFGDGNTLSTFQNIDTIYHTYLLPGTFTVTLTGQNSCTDTTTTMQITVFPKPQAAFTANTYTTCIGLPIQFTNQSGSATSYFWQFGDSYTSTLVNPVHSYTAPGIYDVKLIIYRVNAPGNVCVDSVTQQVQIVTGLPGNFNILPYSATCVPVTLTFVNQNRPSVTSVWDFGDGFTGTGDSVLHTYSAAGTYTIKLTVTVPGGCTYTSQQTVILNGPSGTLQYTGGYHCYPDPVRFEAQAVNTNTLVWDFGDGNTLSTNQLVVYHVYQNPGTYIPKVTLQNAAGCNYFIQGPDTIKVDRIDAGFALTQQSYCGSTTLALTDTSHVFFGVSSVTWDFGDGNNGTGTSVNHVYTNTGIYTIQMIVLANSGCRDTIIKQVNVFVKNIPVAAINAADTACSNQPVLFSGQIQSTDAINMMQWQVSNGVSASGQQLTYSFNSPGNYLVNFIAGTVNGCYDTAYLNIHINPSPVIVSTASLTLCRGNSAQLNVTGAAQYQWTPAQGLSCSSCSSPVASPVNTTAFVVTGTNNFGCTGTDTTVITVIQPLNMVTSGNDTLCIGRSVNLMASGASIYNWSPAQGLNNTSISNPIASPTVTTTYRVVGYDGYNCFTDTSFIVVAVGQYPVVRLGPDQTLSTGTVFPLLSTIQNGPVRNWQWTPDINLDCNNCPQPNALIKNNISYVLNATNIYGCSGSDTIRISVFCTDAQVYIPNAFSPDGDGINDILMVRGKGILSVKSFRVFNRWGEIVFERANFPPNNPAYGWNGKIKGVEAPPDVFVYTAEVICDNGTPYSYHGNVSVIK